jgi:hypothetical protein
MVHPHTGTEELYAAAGTRGFDLGGLEAAGVSEVLGDRRRERIDGR